LIDNKTGAGIGRRVNVCRQIRVLGHKAGSVMVEVTAAYAALKQFCECIGVSLVGYIKYGDFVTILRNGFNTRNQIYVAFYAGDELRVARIFQAQLMQRADAIGVAVENIVVFTQCNLLRPIYLVCPPGRGVCRRMAIVIGWR
jgi:hypothetical protein